MRKSDLVSWNLKFFMDRLLADARMVRNFKLILSQYIFFRKKPR